VCSPEDERAGRKSLEEVAAVELGVGRTESAVGPRRETSSAHENRAQLMYAENVTAAPSSTRVGTATQCRPPPTTGLVSVHSRPPTRLRVSVVPSGADPALFGRTVLGFGYLDAVERAPARGDDAARLSPRRRLASSAAASHRSDSRASVPGATPMSSRPGCRLCTRARRAASRHRRFFLLRSRRPRR